MGIHNIQYYALFKIESDTMIIVYIFTFIHLYVHTCACNLVGLGRRGLGASPEESRINQLRSQIDEVKAVVSDLFTEHMYKLYIIICTCTWLYDYPTHMCSKK